MAGINREIVLDIVVCTELIEVIDSCWVSVMCGWAQSLLKIQLNKVSENQSTYMLGWVCIEKFSRVLYLHKGSKFFLIWGKPCILQRFPPMCYVVGTATRTYKRDDLYPTCSYMHSRAIQCKQGSYTQRRIQGWGVQGTSPPPPPSPAVTSLH